ncbi:MAG: hypothetical protein PVG60_01060 [Desulfarculaceae bacterium]
MKYTDSHSYLEELFLKDYARKHLKQIRYALALGAVIFAAFIPYDLAFLSKGATHLTWIRLLVSGPLLMSVLALSFHKSFLRFQQAAISLAALGAGLGSTIISTMITPELRYTYVLGLMDIIIFVFILMRLRFIWAAITTLLLISFYNIAAIGTIAFPLYKLAAENSLLLTAAIIGSLGCYWLERCARYNYAMEHMLNQKNQDLTKALNEIKTLSGLLPICSSCKKIRDDKGYWNQVEDYVAEHTEASFSHSICPECMEQLYPQIAARLKKDT